MKLNERVALILSMGIMAIGLITFSTGSPVKVQETDTVETQNTDTVPDQGTVALPETKNPSDEAPTPQAAPAVVEKPASVREAETEPVATPEPTKAPTATPTPTAIPTPTPVPNNLVCEEIPEIHDLIASYLAAKLTGTEEAFKGIVDDVSKVDISTIQKRMSSVQAYDDVITYTKRGYGDVAYVVYYTYCMDIADIDTPAVSIDSNYIMVDESGNYMIKLDFSDIDAETKANLVALNGDEDVQELITVTYAVMEKALANDAALLDFWLMLYQPVTDEEAGKEAGADNTGAVSD